MSSCPFNTQVREDYSADGDAWLSFPHEQARSRAYRWGEDGLAGISDNHQRLCFSIALWNGQDKILKERLYGVTNHEGKGKTRDLSDNLRLSFLTTRWLLMINRSFCALSPSRSSPFSGNHGEDVKELYYYLDNTPTHSYMKVSEPFFVHWCDRDRGLGRKSGILFPSLHTCIHRFGLTEGAEAYRNLRSLRKTNLTNATTCLFACLPPFIFSPVPVQIPTGGLPL